MTQPITAALLGQLRQQTALWMETYSVPGVAIGLILDGEESTLCLGVTSIENPLPITDDTLFLIGSTTKTFTATAAMRLVEDGKLDLDAPVRTYLPDFELADQDAAATVTTRHLFNHTGGWVGDVFENTGNGDDALQQIVARLHEWPQVTPIGSVWAYNNAKDAYQNSCATNTAQSSGCAPGIGCTHVRHNTHRTRRTPSVGVRPASPTMIINVFIAGEAGRTPTDCFAMFAQRLSGSALSLPDGQR